MWFSRWLDAHEAGEPVDTVTFTNLVGDAGMTSISGWSGMSPTGMLRRLGTTAGTIEIYTSAAGATGLTVGITWGAENKPATVIPDHIYYIRMMAWGANIPEAATNTGGSFFPWGNAQTSWQRPISTEDYGMFSARITNTQSGAPTVTQTAFTMGSSIDLAGLSIFIKEPMIIDLTECFGAGNEPNKADCDVLPFFEGTISIVV